MRLVHLKTLRIVTSWVNTVILRQYFENDLHDLHELRNASNQFEKDRIQNLVITKLLAFFWLSKLSGHEWPLRTSWIHLRKDSGKQEQPFAQGLWYLISCFLKREAILLKSTQLYCTWTSALTSFSSSISPNWPRWLCSVCDLIMSACFSVHFCIICNKYKCFC